MAVVAGTDSAPSRYYVQLDAGLAAIAYLDMKLVQQQQGDDSPPVEISDAELAPFKDPDVESVSSDDIPMFELEGPTGYNSLEDASVCAVFSGDDPTAVALMLCGGQGNVSVTANVAPRLMHELCVAAIAGDVKKAMEIQFKLMPVHKQLFVEANPIPVKWAAARMGLCGGTLGLPMTPLSKANEPVIEQALKSAGLL